MTLCMPVSSFNCVRCHFRKYPQIVLKFMYLIQLNAGYFLLKNMLVGGTGHMHGVITNRQSGTGKGRQFILC